MQEEVAPKAPIRYTCMRRLHPRHPGTQGTQGTHRCVVELVEGTGGCQSGGAVYQGSRPADLQQGGVVCGRRGKGGAGLGWVGGFWVRADGCPADLQQAY